VTTAGRIHSISVSQEKGDKKRNVGEARLVKDYGIDGDAHAGSERQVSLLPLESFSKLDDQLVVLKPGVFAENITTTGLDFADVAVGCRLTMGDEIELVVTQIGKECHHGCYIRETVGDCIMPREGVFARVVKGGVVCVGDAITWD
jgi:MOSC domain-containing protein YiiM